MLYGLQQGPTEQKILQLCLREHRPLPKAIQNAPELLPGLDLFYTAYLDLQTCRQIGFDEGPVPWNAVNDYAMRYEFSDEQHDDLQFFVRQLDDAYLKFRKEQRKHSSSK